MRWMQLVVLVLTGVGCGDGSARVVPLGGLSQGLAAGPCTVEDVTVRDFGRVVYIGDVDLFDEVLRIVRGEHLPFKHDGTVFNNREHRLPEHERGYYHEFVHPTPGVRGPGPQRVVMGAESEIEYTEDHYATFHLLPDACLRSVSEDLPWAS